MLGKILRIDPNQIEPGLAHRTPSDNPSRSKDLRREIYAYGLGASGALSLTAASAFFGPPV